LDGNNTRFLLRVLTHIRYSFLRLLKTGGKGTIAMWLW